MAYTALENMRGENEQRFGNDVGPLQPALADGIRLWEPFEDDGTDELAVHHALGLAEDNHAVGILLVDGVDPRDGRFVLYKAQEGFATAC